MSPGFSGRHGRLHMGIQQIASGKWRAQIRRKNAKFDQVFNSEIEARQAHARFLAQVSPKASAITVQNAWKLYEESLEFAAKRERTRRTEAGRIKRWLDEFGLTPVNEVTADDVENYIAQRLRSKPQPGPDTVRLEVASFSALMKYCVRKKYVAANPCIGVSRPGGSRKLQRMSQQDIGQLMQLLKNPNRRFRYAARLCLLVLATGARPGEWCAALMSDVDLTKGVVLFRETKYRGQPRSVPLTPVAKKLLADHLAEIATDPELNLTALGSDVLFPVVGKKGAVRPFHYTGALRDAKKKNLLPRSVRAHLGRHEFISTLVESSKLDDSRIMALVGHHSPASMEIYKHVRNVQFRGDIEDVESRVMRPQRAESLAATLDLPVPFINLMLELRRAKEAQDGIEDTGDELLYEPAVIQKFQELAEVISSSPAQKASLMEWVKRRRDELRREKEALSDSSAPEENVVSVLADVQPWQAAVQNPPGDQSVESTEHDPTDIATEARRRVHRDASRTRKTRPGRVKR